MTHIVLGILFVVSGAQPNKPAKTPRPDPKLVVVVEPGLLRLGEAMRDSNLAAFTRDEVCQSAERHRGEAADAERRRAESALQAQKARAVAAAAGTGDELGRRAADLAKVDAEVATKLGDVALKLERSCRSFREKSVEASEAFKRALASHGKAVTDCEMHWMNVATYVSLAALRRAQAKTWDDSPTGTKFANEDYKVADEYEAICRKYEAQFRDGGCRLLMLMPDGTLQPAPLR